MDRVDAQRLASEKQATAHARKMLKKQMRNGGVRRVDVTQPMTAPMPLQVFAKQQPVAKSQPAHKRKERQVGVPVDTDLSPRARFINENIAFLEAPDRRAQLVAVSRMWATAMEALGIECPMIEAPGAAIAQLAIGEALSGKTPRLYQGVKQNGPVKTVRYPFVEWTALMSLLLCAKIVERTDNDIHTSEDAIKVVIRDTEKDLGCQLDKCLSQRKGHSNKGADTRINDLVRRLLDADAELRSQTAAAGREIMGRWYRDDSKVIEAETPERLREFDRYRMTRMVAVNLLASINDDRDDLIKPKAGKGRRPSE